MLGANALHVHSHFHSPFKEENVALLTVLGAGQSADNAKKSARNSGSNSKLETNKRIILDFQMRRRYACIRFLRRYGRRACATLSLGKCSSQYLGYRSSFPKKLVHNPRKRLTRCSSLPPKPDIRRMRRNHCARQMPKITRVRSCNFQQNSRT
jgi:hypothetical protein